MLLFTYKRTQHKWATLLPCYCVLLLFPYTTAAQNLVPNPSFEELDTCPYIIGFQGQSKPINWEKWNQSPEYFHSCALPVNGSDTLLSVPQNGFGFQYAWEGDAYVGMGIYDGANDFREYAGCELLVPLQVGQTYYLSLYYNMAMGGNYWAPNWASNNMGVLFTMQSNVWSGLTGPPFVLRNYAHLYDPVVNTDTAGWTLLSGSFVADSAYQYMVLGNFFSDALTDTIHVLGASSLGAYAFVDGVCVSPSPNGCPLMLAVEELDQPRLNAYPNPANNQLEVEALGWKNAEWEVFDVMGRKVMEGMAGSSKFIIDLTGQAEGQFILRTKGAFVQHIKFVVVH